MMNIRLNNSPKSATYKKIGLKIVVSLLLFAFVDIPTADAQRYSVDKENESVDWQAAPAPPASGHEPPTPPTPPGNPPAQTPIDGGLGLLLAAGGAYAVRRLRNNNEMTSDTA